MADWLGKGLDEEYFSSMYGLIEHLKYGNIQVSNMTCFISYIPYYISKRKEQLLVPWK